MITFLIRRSVYSLAVLFAVSLISFFLVRLIPGDTATLLLGVRYDEAAAEALRKEMGLDRPMVLQYFHWLSQLFQGHWGVSSFANRPVWDLVFERLPVTLELMIASAFLGIPAGIALGVWGALHSRSHGGQLASVFGMLGISIPPFYLGTLLILGLSLAWPLFPSGGWIPWEAGWQSHLSSVFLPALSLALTLMAVVSSLTRSTVEETLSADYLRTAKAKGLARRKLLYGHALRNALLPVLTLTGIQIGYLLAGSVVIEEVFSLPGLGRLVWQALSHRDYGLFQICVLFIASVFIVTNTAVDLLCAWLDPRVRRI